MQKEPQTQPLRLEMPERITEQVWPDGTVPVVSVFCITYNHAKFIREAIEGFLMQETTFPVEIFVHDDASTDGTADIVKEYADKYPQLFWKVLQLENQWSKGNKKILFDYLAKQRGEFIAMCEGDDYWTNPKKLQKQVDLLNVDPMSSLSYHPIESERQGVRKLSPASTNPTITSVAEVLNIRGLHTSAMVFRRNLVAGSGTWMLGLPVGDIPLQLHLADAGNMLFMPDTSSVYRKHAGGWTAGTRLETPRVVDALREVLLAFNRHSAGRHRPLVYRRLLDLHLGAVSVADQEGDRRAWRRHRRLALATLGMYPEVPGLIKCISGNVFGVFVRNTYFRLCAMKNVLIGNPKATSNG
jgi:glycosyltransferase involved in cell wall biosynthesis